MQGPCPPLPPLIEQWVGRGLHADLLTESPPDFLNGFLPLGAFGAHFRTSEKNCLIIPIIGTLCREFYQLAFKQCSNSTFCTKCDFNNYFQNLPQKYLHGPIRTKISRRFQIRVVLGAGRSAPCQIFDPKIALLLIPPFPVQNSM